jgi:FSR family fosmidomycin resistance protein-like MFS transporter
MQSPVPSAPSGIKMAEDKGKLYLGYLVSSHFVIHVFTFLLPALLIPFQEELGYSIVQLSLLSSVPKLLNVLIYIPTGVLSDKYPSKILTASFAITVLGSIVVPMSSTFPALLLGFVLLSVGSTLYHPPSLKMASEFSTTKVTYAMGIHNIGSSLGFAAGPLLLSYFMAKSTWQHTFYVWGAFTILMTMMTYFYTRDNLQGAESSRDFNVFKGIRVLLTRQYALVIGISCFVEALFNIIVMFVPAYFTLEMGVSHSVTSFIAGLMPMTGIAGSLIGGYAGYKFGIYRVGVVIMALMAGLLFVFPSMGTVILTAGVYGLYRCLQAAFMPILNGLITGHSSSENRSLAFSFNFVLVNLLGSVATTGVSILIESYGTPVIFPIAIAAVIPVVGLILMLQRIADK